MSGEKVSTIKGLGPAMDAACAAAGIDSAAELRGLGPDAAYEALLQAGTRPHFIGYYALVMALQGRPWNDCRGAEKAALRKRFDRIVAVARAGAVRDAVEADDIPPAALRAALDRIGLREKP